MSIFKNKIFLISIIIWCFITVVRFLNHVPWLDEAHAWTIAEELNIVEIFKLMKVEGHTVLWYIMLMPFAKAHFHYPYPMQILNWSFCFLALIILWAKAPFSNLIKVLITFSFPFLAVYSVYARCYSIGILLLFLLAVYYKDKLKHPVLYSILIVLCANTSAMAMFGAAAFGILFLWDFIKSKSAWKKFILPIVILVLGAVFVLLQMGGADTTKISDYKGIEFIFSKMRYVIPLLSLVIFGVPLMMFFRKIPSALFFIVFTYSCLTYCFLFKYYGHFWNHYFYYIYLIIAIWLALDSNVNIKKSLKVSAIIILGIISFFNWFYFYISKDVNLKYVFKSDDEKWIKIILNDNNIKNKTLILDNIDFGGFMLKPYNKFNLKNYCEDRPYNYDRLNYPAQNELCYFPDNNKNLYNTAIFQDRLSSLVDDECYALLPINAELFGENNELIITSYDGLIKYQIKRYKCLSSSSFGINRCLYKIKKVN